MFISFSFIWHESCKVTDRLVAFILFFSSLISLQTITAAPLISSSAATIAAFPKDGFVMERMTAVTVRTRPTLPAQVMHSCSSFSLTLWWFNNLNLCMIILSLALFAQIDFQNLYTSICFTYISGYMNAHNILPFHPHLLSRILIYFGASRSCRH